MSVSVGIAAETDGIDYICLFIRYLRIKTERRQRLKVASWAAAINL